MSNTICLNKKEILHIKNSLLYSVHQKIYEIIEKDNIKISQELEKLLELLDQDNYGFGMIYIDLADYIHSEKTCKLFLNLFEEAVKQEHTEHAFTPEALFLLQNFLDDLRLYCRQIART